jgi:hypothetical protein
MAVEREKYERFGSRLSPPLGDVSRNAPGPVERVIALGASNLTRGFNTVVATSRAAWGPRVEVVAALGHGRSYGADSQFLARRLPGIIESGLWPTIERLPAARTRALVTDVGNDIVYGFPATQILAWIDEVVERLQRVTRDIVLTDLPMHTLRRLSTRKFLFFRTLFVPRCQMSLAEVIDVAELVSGGLEQIAARRQCRFVRLEPEWYGVDPIHMRVGVWRRAWQHILCDAVAPPTATKSWIEGMRLYFMPAERQSLFGVERLRPQHGVALEKGATVWLF